MPNQDVAHFDVPVNRCELEDHLLLETIVFSSVSKQRYNKNHRICVRLAVGRSHICCHKSQRRPGEKLTGSVNHKHWFTDDASARSNFEVRYQYHYWS